MTTVERVKNLCLTPNTEWPVIAGETTPAGSLISGYVAPLAAVSAVAGLVGGSLVGYTLPFIGTTYRVPIAAGLVAAVFTVVMAVVGVFVLSLVINALAPTFAAEKNSDQALKVAAYSFTPAWVAGVFMIVPALGALAMLGGLYGLYLLYLGLPRLMKCPEDRAIGYIAVVVICAIVVGMIIAMTGGMITGVGMMGAGTVGSAIGARAPVSGAQFNPNSPLGALQGLGRGSRRAPERSRPRRRAATRARRSRRPSRVWARCSAAADASSPLTSSGSRASCPTRSPGCREREAAPRRPASSA